MSVESDVQSGARTAAEPAVAARTGNPALVALPCFLIGSISLGLWLIDFLPRDLPGGLISAVFFVSGIGVWIGALWAARLGQSANAGVFAIFGAFWTSFGFLLFGLVNGLFGISEDAAVAADQVKFTQATFLIAWLAVFLALTLSTLRLPLAFTALFLFVDIAVALVLGAVLNGSTLLFTLAGISVFVFAAVGVYLFMDGMGQELGGRALPLGSPVLR